MIKLLRSAVASAALSWAWANRSQIISFVKRTTSSKAPEVRPTGYGETIGDDALIDPSVVA